MSEVVTRDYGRAISTRTVQNTPFTALREPHSTNAYIFINGRKVCVRVIFETAVDTGAWQEYTLGCGNVDSQLFDATGFRWNQLFDNRVEPLVDAVSTPLQRLKQIQTLKKAEASGAKPRRGGEFHAHFERLQEIAQLEKGWDSYDADPPSEIARVLAKTLLEKLEERGLTVTFITATSSSSIMVRHTANGSSVTWEIDPDGEIGVMVERAGGPTRFHSPAAPDIAGLVEELAQNG